MPKGKAEDAADAARDRLEDVELGAAGLGVGIAAVWYLFGVDDLFLLIAILIVAFAVGLDEAAEFT